MNIALILSGGKGSRMQSDIPKQYIKLCGQEVLLYTVMAFYNHSEIDKIAVVCDKEYKPLAESIAANAKEKLLFVTLGGDTRTESSKKGLEALAGIANDNDMVLIHDAARPFVASNTISDCIAACNSETAAVAAVAAIDTIAVAKDGAISDVLDRQALFCLQTPQAFVYRKIAKAYAEFAGTATDDSAVYRACGGKVCLVQGSQSNIKITSPDDIARATAILQQKEK